MTTQPEALRLAEELDDGYPLTGDAISAAAELRSQHARITELEAQLSAIGAGGVSPLMNAAQEATHLRELAAYRLTVENLEREIAAITSETGNPASAQGAAITSESETQPAPALWVSPEQFANFMDADEAEFGKYIPARKTSAGKFTMPLFAARAQADSVTAPAGGAVSAPVFAFRRKGLDDFCTCTEERYAELSAKPNLFETRIFYTTPPAQAADSVLEDAARYRWLFGARTKEQVENFSDTVMNPLPQDDVLSMLQCFFIHKAGVDAVVDAARKQGEKQ